MVLERIYNEFIGGASFQELEKKHGVPRQARTVLRDYLFLRAEKEKPPGYKTDTADLARRLGTTQENLRRARFYWRKMPPEFQNVIMDSAKLKEVGEALGGGKLHSLLANKIHWNKNHWRMTSALAIAAHEGSFRNSRANPLYYLLRKHGRSAIEGLVSAEDVRRIASNERISLRKNKTPLNPQLTAEQRELIKEFGATDSDAEIARALDVPEIKVFYARAHMRVRKITDEQRKQSKAVEALRQVLAEKGSTRLTDNELRIVLKAKGIELARRTVNKHRRLLQKQRS